MTMEKVTMDQIVKSVNGQIEVDTARIEEILSKIDDLEKQLKMQTAKDVKSRLFSFIFGLQGNIVLGLQKL